MSLRLHIALFISLLSVPIRALDVDSGMDAIRLSHALTSPQLSAFPVRRSLGGGGSLQPSMRGWVRLRGIDLNKVPETREALANLRAKGIKTCVFLRLSSPDWKRKYLPDDLRESYEHGRKLGAAYGDLVDAWEVDNEPDLGFVPESAERYTAFLKAMYLGLKAGSREQGAGSLNNPQVSLSAVGQAKAEGFPQAPLVIMGSLGLPPGPWLERFAANDGFAYTDGYNYHYYGYAEDFTGVYHQHEAAIRELGARSVEPGADSLKLIAKSYPIYLTEVGYGMLGKETRDTKEGRLRQWRWIKSVGEQANALRIEAPMAFFLPPYLEYDVSEYGLTVPATPAAGSKEQGARSSNPDETSYHAGGIDYSPGDFGAEKAEPWMELIGSVIGGNQATPALAQWLAARHAPFSDQSSALAASYTNNPQPITNDHDGSRAWSISVPRPSPVVIDFLPGQGLSHIKRFNGLFVNGLEPPVHTKPETGRRLGGDGEANLKPEVLPTQALPLTPSPSAPPRNEEFILQIRTQNGNLYEVYPTRQATPAWQRFMEPGENFTLSFYGRAALPWRFKDNKPASLVVVMYPKQLPATYEFRRPQLIELNSLHKPETGNLKPESFRYGAGTVVLYNFSDNSVAGRLELPPALGPLTLTPDPSVSSASSVLTFAPGERREIPVSIKVPWDHYERIPAEIRFVSIAENPQVSGFRSQVSDSPVARHRTDLLPDLANRPTRLVADLLSTDNRQLTTNNRDFVATRPRASEEGPMVELIAESKGPSAKSNLSGALSTSPHALTAFVQSGATVERTTNGFTITITARQPGKPQRIEVEIPWPDGLAFAEDEFLSVEFRLSPDPEISGLRSQVSGLSPPNQ